MITAKLYFALLLTFLSIHLPAAANQPKWLELPQPDGPHAVGTRTLLLADKARKRDLLVTVWFPAEGGSSLAPYMDRRTAEELAKEWQLQSGFEQGIRTHAWGDARIEKGGPFPVVLLEHGSGVVPAVYTVLAEGLASHGYIVAATNHPPDSLIAAYPDGHEIKSTPYWPVDADRQTQGIAIGEFADAVLVADVRFVLDELHELNSHDEFWRGSLDFSRVGIVGHSMGGTTAALATLKDKRIRAGVNLDGSTYPGMNADVRPIPLNKPLLFMVTQEHADNPATQVREYVGAKSRSYYVVVAGNDHMSFTDVRLVQNRFSRKAGADRTTNDEALATLKLTRSLVEQFLGKYLRDEIAPELDALVRIERK